MKKFLKVIIILLVIGGFALFLFWLISPVKSPLQNNFISKVRDFSPFGNSGTSEENVFDNQSEYNTSTNSNILDANRELPTIEQVYSSPVSGYTVLTNGSSTIIRLVDRATGHIIDVNTLTKERVRVSNTTLPAIIEAIWFNNGSGVIMRYLREETDVVETLLVANLNTNGGETSGTYLEENISSLIVSSSGDEIIYLVPSGFGSKIIAYNIKTNVTKTLYTGALKEFGLLAGDTDRIYVQTKASYKSLGYLYSLSRKTGVLTKVITGGTGFNALLSDDLGKIFATTGGDSAISYIYDQSFIETTFSNISTIANKCIFKDSLTLYCAIPSIFPENMPDSWYMGLNSLNDQIWFIDINGESSFITDLQNIDAIKLAFSENNELFFVNKKNGTVWIVRLNQL